ncbi:hypothetical protein DFH08DRAFT_820231 [Mycena albidolilacea]|uniref:Uncharacterized protein n=1 Tax=Mycena albidolilacea TaxID=1033008 RepID=A0AAD6ZDE8_9AGAR|nr:hypothetical protein DFH08DRAFT_820231 [Mycena albidolilacea]
MSSAAYTPLPTAANPNGQSAKDLLSRLTPAAPPTRIRRLLIFVAVLALSSVLLVYVVFAPSSFSLPGSGSSSGSTSDSGSIPGGYSHNEDLNNDASGWGGTNNDDQGGVGSGSPFFRDNHPALHARLFLARAQAEISARKLDTCGGQLSARMVDAYITGAVPYCTSPASASTASITCFPAGGASDPSSPNHWWPYPQAFCASQHLGHTPGWGGPASVHGQFTGRCEVSGGGNELKAAMGREGFLGKEFVEDKNAGEGCTETLTHPVLFVPRQDRWNPFHVGEDLVTTFLALTLFSRHQSSSSSASTSSAAEQQLWTALPAAYAKTLSSSASSAKAEFSKLTAELAHEVAHTAGLQLVFTDEYLPTESLFAPLYDRMGAFPPRRMAVEGLANTCLARAFHSVGAGASLLSATGVGRPHTCASELVWGTSLWLRWVWGLEGLPGSSSSSLGSRAWEEVGVRRRSNRTEGQVEREDVEQRAPVTTHAQAQGGDPIQVLFLSREKFDAYTRHKNHKLTAWQEARHIANEGELLAGLRAGLGGLCRVATAVAGSTPHTPGTHDCTYTDADLLPGVWGSRLHPREARALGLGVGTAPPPSDVDADAKKEESTVGVGGGGAAPVGAPPGEGLANERRAPLPSDGSTSNNTARAARPRALRFATLDPTTSALPAQLGAVGRADVVVSVHAGALGLTLFMPTGRASVVELMTTGAQGNWHFHNMAHMLGMEYLRIDVQKNVDVAKVVQGVRDLVERRLQK